MSYSAMTIARGAEGVGLDDVGTGSQIRGVNLFDDVGPAEHEDVVVAVLAAELVQRKVAGLDGGAHRAVVDDDALLDGF